MPTINPARKVEYPAPYDRYLAVLRAEKSNLMLLGSNNEESVAEGIRAALRIEKGLGKYSAERACENRSKDAARVLLAAEECAECGISDHDECCSVTEARFNLIESATDCSRLADLCECRWLNADYIETLVRSFGAEAEMLSEDLTDFLSSLEKMMMPGEKRDD